MAPDYQALHDRLEALAAEFRVPGLAYEASALGGLVGRLKLRLRHDLKPQIAAETPAPAGPIETNPDLPNEAGTEADAPPVPPLSADVDQVDVEVSGPAGDSPADDVRPEASAEVPDVAPPAPSPTPARRPVVQKAVPRPAAR